MKKPLLILFSVVTILTALAFGTQTVNAETEYTEGNLTYTIKNGEATITDCDTSVSGELIIPDTLGGYPVTKISSYTFNNCTELTSIEIPVGVTSIGNSAFSNCKNLISLNVDVDNTAYSSVNGILFDKKASQIICYPAGRVNSSYMIPGGVTHIGDEAFYNCSNLTSVVIPNGVTRIGDRAFYNCSSLKYVNIPDSVVSIGSSAFYNIDDEYYTSAEILETQFYIGNYLVDLHSDMMWGTNVIREGTRVIADQLLFWGWDSTSVEIPDSVINIGEGAFSYWNDLKNINVDADNAVYSSINGVLFDKEATEIIKYPAGKISSSYIIPDGVTSVSEGAFSSCNNLTSITLPGSIKSINKRAFSACTSLKDVYYNGTEKDWNGVSIDPNSNSCLLSANIHFAELLGDVDSNNVLNGEDVLYLLYNILFGNEYYPVDTSCDFDGNGVEDSDDAVYLLYHVLFGEERFPLY